MRSIKTILRTGPRSLAHPRPLTAAMRAVTIRRPLTFRPPGRTPIVLRSAGYSRYSGYSSAGDSDSDAYSGRYSRYSSAGDSDAYSGNSNADSKQRNWYLQHMILKPLFKDSKANQADEAFKKWRLNHKPSPETFHFITVNFLDLKKPALALKYLEEMVSTFKSLDGDMMKHVLKKAAKVCSANDGQMSKIKAISGNLKINLIEKKADKGRRAPRGGKKKSKLAKSTAEAIRKLDELDSEDKGYKYWTEKMKPRMRKVVARARLSSEDEMDSSENEMD